MNNLPYNERNKEIFSKEFISYGEYCSSVKELNRIVNNIRVDEPKADADLVVALLDAIIAIYKQRERVNTVDKEDYRQERLKVLEYARKWQNQTGYVSDDVVNRRFKK